jgi:hypothetical protein
MSTSESRRKPQDLKVEGKLFTGVSGFKYLGKQSKQTPWQTPQARTIPTERLPLVAKLVPTLEDRRCRVISATNPPQSLISLF